MWVLVSSRQQSEIYIYIYIYIYSYIYNFFSQMQFSRLTPGNCKVCLLHSIPRMPRYDAQGDFNPLKNCFPSLLVVNWLPANTGAKECEQNKEVLIKLRNLNATLSFTKSDMSQALSEKVEEDPALQNMSKDNHLRRVPNHVCHVSHTLHRPSPTPMMRPTRFVWKPQQIALGSIPDQAKQLKNR